MYEGKKIDRKRTSVFLQKLKTIYRDYKNGNIGRKGLIYSLSMWEKINPETLKDFERGLRLKRTIITEIKRFLSNSSQSERPDFDRLAVKYIKAYLEWLYMTGYDAGKYPFSRYIEAYILSHETASLQYNRLKERDMFIELIKKIEKDMD